MVEDGQVRCERGLVDEDEQVDESGAGEVGESGGGCKRKMKADARGLPIRRAKRTFNFEFPLAVVGLEGNGSGT